MRGERGTVTLWLLGLCVLLLAFGGLSLDLWRAFSERRALAAAADAAALAGATALDTAAYRSGGVVHLVPAEARRRAFASLAAQPDRRSMRGGRVDADVDEVRVEVDGRVELTLLRLFAGGRSFDVTVRASARPFTSR